MYCCWQNAISCQLLLPLKSTKYTQKFGVASEFLYIYYIVPSLVDIEWTIYHVSCKLQ
jgi:hypothetical protein